MSSGSTTSSASEHNMDSGLMQQFIAEDTEVLRAHVQLWKHNLCTYLFAQYASKFTLAKPTRGRFDTREYRAMFKALDHATRNKMPELVRC
jgi:hypothetical protein